MCNIWSHSSYKFEGNSVLSRYRPEGGGVVKKNFDGGVRLRFLIGYPWLRKFWSKTYPWLKRISWSWAHFYMILRNFSLNIPFLREIFRKQTPFMGFHEKIYLWLRTSEENIPLAKESGLKKWLEHFPKTCQHSLKKLSFRCHWQFQTYCLQNLIR